MTVLKSGTTLATWSGNTSGFSNDEIEYYQYILFGGDNVGVSYNSEGEELCINWYKIKNYIE